MQEISRDEILVIIKLKHPDPHTDTLAYVDSLPDEVLMFWSINYGNNIEFHASNFDKKVEILNTLLFEYYERKCQ